MLARGFDLTLGFFFLHLMECPAPLGTLQRCSWHPGRAHWCVSGLYRNARFLTAGLQLLETWHLTYPKKTVSNPFLPYFHESVPNKITRMCKFPGESAVCLTCLLLENAPATARRIWAEQLAQWWLLINGWMSFQLLDIWIDLPKFRSCSLVLKACRPACSSRPVLSPHSLTQWTPIDTSQASNKLLFA